MRWRTEYLFILGSMDCTVANSQLDCNIRPGLRDIRVRAHCRYGSSKYRQSFNSLLIIIVVMTQWEWHSPWYMLLCILKSLLFWQVKKPNDGCQFLCIYSYVFGSGVNRNCSFWHMIRGKWHFSEGYFSFNEIAKILWETTLWNPCIKFLGADQ